MHSKLSIIIPSYNCGAYVVRAIESCLQQDYDNIEVIVVNDGSSDSTSVILKKYDNDSRVTVLNQHNQGVSAARNNGMKLATGNFISFLDADDEIKRNTIKPNMEFLDKHKDIDWLLFPIRRINKEGKEVHLVSENKMPSYNYPQIIRLTSKEAFELMDSNQLPSSVCGCIFKKEFTDYEFEPCRFEDTIMVMKLLCKNKDLILSPYGAYLYYDQEESFINAEWTPDKWISYVNARLRILDTRQFLFPDDEKKINKIKTSIYYNLRYLKDIHTEDKSFESPLNYFTNKNPKVEKSVKSYFIYRLKTCLRLIKKFVTQQ